MIYRVPSGDGSSREKHWGSFTPGCKAPSVLGTGSSAPLPAARGRRFTPPRQKGYEKSSNKLSQTITGAGKRRGEFSNLWSCPRPSTARTSLGSGPPLRRSSVEKEGSHFPEIGALTFGWLTPRSQRAGAF